MKDALQSIERMLEVRFGKTDAQALKFGRARIARKDIQFMDVKHLSELAERYRTRARGQILAYRVWQQAQEGQNDSIARLYGAAEGAILQRQVRDAVQLWYFAHRDYHAMRRAYLIKCMGPDVQAEWRKAG